MNKADRIKGIEKIIQDCMGWDNTTASANCPGIAMAIEKAISLDEDEVLSVIIDEMEVYVPKFSVVAKNLANNDEVITISEDV